MTKWDNQELKVLLEYYRKSSKEHLCKLLPDRTWSAIKLKANQFRLRRFVARNKLADLNILLEDTPITYYWIGFLLADGHFSKDDKISLNLGHKDIDHLNRFCRFVNYKGNANLSNGISLMDVKVVKVLKEKFGLCSIKTYNPLKFFRFEDDLLISLIIGFIDGDGNIQKQSGNRKDCLIRIKMHASWQAALNVFVKTCYEFTGLPRCPIAKINKSGYSKISIGDYRVIKFLKKKSLDLSLPILTRKWDIIDLNRISKMEQAKLNEINVLRLKKEGFRNSEIAKLLGISPAAITGINKRLEAA